MFVYYPPLSIVDRLWVASWLTLVHCNVTSIHIVIGLLGHRVYFAVYLFYFLRQASLKGLIDYQFLVPAMIDACQVAVSFTCLFSIADLLFSHGVVSQRRSCPVGKFCALNANCTSDVNLCVTVCPTPSDRIQQGNWTTGNCERSKLHFVCISVTV